MQLRIQARDIEIDAGTRRQIERRMRLALGRHAGRIAVARVQLGNGSLGAPNGEKKCSVRLRLLRGEQLEIDEQAPELLAAVEHASWRLEHRLARAGRPLAGRDAWSSPRSRT